MSYGQSFVAWREATPFWAAYTQHRFVQGLADGTLPRASFVHYLKQDYVFLIHFARAWALAVTKADCVEEMRLAAATVNGLINDEMVLHIKTCAAEGIDEVSLFKTQERTENLAYTRYVLDAGHSGDLLDLLAALAPCVMGYGEIGKALARAKTSNKYDEWIGTYASPDYQAMCHAAGALIDGAVMRRLGDAPTKSPRWSALEKRFATATRLEIGFWDMGLCP